MAATTEQGWYFDPYGVHEERWFSDGRPSALVRDHGVEQQDAPPPTDPWAPLIERLADEPDGTETVRFGPFPIAARPRPNRRQVARQVLVLVMVPVLTVGLLSWLIAGMAGAAHPIVVAVIPALFALVIGVRLVGSEHIVRHCSSVREGAALRRRA